MTNKSQASLDLRRAQLITELQEVERNILRHKTMDREITRANILEWAKANSDETSANNCDYVLFKIAKDLITHDLQNSTKGQLVQKCLDLICGGSEMPVDSMGTNRILDRYVNAENLKKHQITTMEEFDKEFNGI